MYCRLKVYVIFVTRPILTADIFLILYCITENGYFGLCASSNRLEILFLIITTVNKFEQLQQW